MGATYRPRSEYILTKSLGYSPLVVSRLLLYRRHHSLLHTTLPAEGVVERVSGAASRPVGRYAKGAEFAACSVSCTDTVLGNPLTPCLPAVSCHPNSNLTDIFLFDAALLRTCRVADDRDFFCWGGSDRATGTGGLRTRTTY